MLVNTKFSDEFEGDSGTIEVEVVNYGKKDRLKIVRKKYFGKQSKPVYKPLGTLSKTELNDLTETIKKASDFMS